MVATATKPAVEPNSGECRMRMVVNGHLITGETVNRRWVFECQSFPEIAARFNGVADTTAAITRFMTLAMGD